MRTVYVYQIIRSFLDGETIPTVHRSNTNGARRATETEFTGYKSSSPFKRDLSLKKMMADDKHTTAIFFENHRAVGQSVIRKENIFHFFSVYVQL